MFHLLNLKNMKNSTVIGMAIGGLLVAGGSILAYFKREEVKDIATQVVDEVKKLMKKDKPASEETTHQGQAEE